MSEERIASLVDAMTVEEQISLLAGRDSWTTTPVERLGIPPIKVTDGPNGARGGGALVDGVKAARVDADITIADKSIGVKGDSVVIIAVNTQPVTIFMGASPIGDANGAGLVNGVIAALKVGS